MEQATLEAPAAQPALDLEALRPRLEERRRLPMSTYRLQLHAGFDFRAARGIVAYLDQLGISDCYCAPYFQARTGSNHGYDITDFQALNAELGSEEDYRAFVAELAEHRLGQVLDFVPNHMAVDANRNQWWRDVLENGPASPYACFFDIDWAPIKSELKGKVLLPNLGDHYGLVLERGELQVDFEAGALVVRYGDQNLPLDPRVYPLVLRAGLETLQAEVPADDAHLQEFLSILTALDHLPPCTELAPERVAERLRERNVSRERLKRLVDAAPRIRQHIDGCLQAINGVAGKPRSFDPLHALLEEQPHRLAYWKTAFDEINYRRFFDIKELAGLRMEEPAVFAATHTLVLRLIRQGAVTGLRLDHLDGLFDPSGYLDKLQEAILLEWAGDLIAPGEGLPPEARQQLIDWRRSEQKRAPGGIADRPCYIVAEKILSANESLAESWPIHGTSGYDFLNDLNRLFVDARRAKDMRRVYERFTDQDTPFAEVVYQSKKLITWTALASELNVLADALNRISEGNRRARDFTLNSLREALRQVVACFPVYRTYVTAAGATEADAQVIETALRRARRRNPAMEATAFDFLRAVLLPKKDQLSDDEYQRRVQFAMKVQQYTGPVQAKGLEDTSFYRYNLLLSLNEVGGDPQRGFATTSADPFHEANRRRQARWPVTMLATSTHDTKRGEDARARLNVLSEMPAEWSRQLSRWARINARHRRAIEGTPAPERNDEYLFYQALLGSWPVERQGGMLRAAPVEYIQRVRDYMLKAVKEAKVHTSWINSNEGYDQAVSQFVESTLAGPRADKFFAEFLPFQHKVARLGMLNSLSQLVLKIASPGVPDFYQGTELWDLSLVDPDNRRPVDYSQRLRMLKDLKGLLDEPAPTESARKETVNDMLGHWEDGRIKLFITAAALRLRRQFPDLFRKGEYLPLEITGDLAEHVVALARRHAGRTVIAVVPRWCNKLTSQEKPLPLGAETWQDTTVLLPEGWEADKLTKWFTGEGVTPAENSGRLAVRVGDLLAACPVALLTRT